MLRNSMLFVTFGILWLFIFSVPVGTSKSVFDVAHYYIVDTRPVYWVVSKVRGSIEATNEGSDRALDAGREVFENRLSKSERFEPFE